MRKRNFTSLEVLAEQVRKAELQIFASKGRAEAREQNFTYLAVKAERKCGCGSGTSHFWSGSAVKHFDSQVKLDVREQILTALTGPYPADCHCQC